MALLIKLIVASFLNDSNCRPLVFFRSASDWKNPGPAKSCSPRVGKRNSDGGSEEAVLATYQAARDPSQLQESVVAALMHGDSLRAAVKEFFADAVVQRCLVHKERNIRSKLSKKHWGELARLFKRLREVQGKDAALEVVGELRIFLKGKNAESLKSLEEVGEDLIALQSLNVPNTLHRSLLSTNAIENSFRNTRNKLGRVTRYRAETDQATRWMAFALLEVEKGFRRISGYVDLPELIAALEAKQAG